MTSLSNLVEEKTIDVFLDKAKEILEIDSFEDRVDTSVTDKVKEKVGDWVCIVFYPEVFLSGGLNLLGESPSNGTFNSTIAFNFGDIDTEEKESVARDTRRIVVEKLCNEFADSIEYIADFDLLPSSYSVTENTTSITGVVVFQVEVNYRVSP